MKAFNHTNAKTLAEAKTALAGGKATIIAGGTDLIGTLKDNILPTYPATVINIKTIPGLDYIKEEAGMLKIGATTRLADIAANPAINQKYTALAQAASARGDAARPRYGDHRRQHRPAASLLVFPQAGKPLQLHPQGRDDLLCHDGRQPLSLDLRRREQVHRGASQRRGPGADRAECQDRHQRRARSRRRISSTSRFRATPCLPRARSSRKSRCRRLRPGAKSAFLKFAIRKSIDFPIVNCAVMVGGGAPRIALNAVAPKPYRAVKAEAAIAGKPINEANAEAAGAAAVEDAKPLAATKYKVQIAKTLVKRALLATV